VLKLSRKRLLKGLSVSDWQPPFSYKLSVRPRTAETAETAGKADAPSALPLFLIPGD